MSDTLSIDVVGPSYWAYVATVMAECLEKVCHTKRIAPHLIPKGVYRDAKDFFRLVLESAGDSIPENPPASLNAYVIATDAIMSSAHSLPNTREGLGDRLEEYAELVDRLNTPGPLTADEVETARALQSFFAKLAQAGEAEVYESTLGFAPHFATLTLFPRH